MDNQAVAAVEFFSRSITKGESCNTLLLLAVMTQPWPASDINFILEKGTGGNLNFAVPVTITPSCSFVLNNFQ